MFLNRSGRLAAIMCGVALMSMSDARAADWKQKDFKVAGGGVLEMEYPLSWGKKPEYDTFETITNFRFGPIGPREKPLFLVSIEAVLALDPISEEELLTITKAEIEKFREMAFETEIPIKDLEGSHIIAHYFSISDSESKRGEYDYLTMAVIASGRLLIKCNFLSSDGAPEFGADAIRMMRSIRYTAPETKPKS